MIAVDLGVIDYETALDFQYAAHELRTGSRVEDILFVMEHMPVLTMGKSGGNDDLLIPEYELCEKGVSLFRLNRGGKITCHYPGQLVAYPVMGIERFQEDVHRYVSGLEDVIIRTLADFGVKGERVPEHRGVFAGSDKVAAIGIEIRNKVTMHGISINVHEDLSLYRLFIPCGIRDRGITFLEKICPSRIKVSMESVKASFLHHFSEVFQERITNLLDRDMFERQYVSAGTTGITAKAIP